MIIVVANEKGGVGKTTISTTIAAGLAARGRKVLIIDADAQGHATTAFGLRKYPGLYDLMVRDAEFKDVIRPVPAERFAVDGRRPGSLHVIGSNTETRSIADLVGNAWALADKLEALGGVYDLIMIDTSPTPSMLHASIYLASDAVLYPTLAEFLSFDGLAESITHRKAVERWKEIGVIGIVPMRVRAQTLEHSENLVALGDQYPGLVWDPIPESIVWAEATTYQMPVQNYAPEHPAAELAWSMVERMEAYCG